MAENLLQAPGNTARSKLMKMITMAEAMLEKPSKIEDPKCPKAIGKEISPRCAMQEV